jgi:hypothetical protein
MKVVTRGLPFQFTTDPATKPVPLIVSSKPEDPGGALVGIKGVLT